MSTQVPGQGRARFSCKLRLRTALMIPLLLQIVATVGLVGYLSFRNGAKAVDDLASQLMSELSLRINQRVESYLAVPKQVQQMNLRAIANGTLNLADFEQTGITFWNQVQTFGVVYIDYTTSQGEYSGAGYFRGAPEIAEITRKHPKDVYAYKPDAQGKRGQLTIQAGNARNVVGESWYREAVAARSTIWSSIYRWASSPDQISIGINTPLYAPKNALRGVLGVDISLSQINTFLQSLQVGKTGRAFIMEGSGRLVAASSQEPSYRLVNGVAEQIMATESGDRLVQSAAQYVQDQFGSSAAVISSQQRRFQHTGTPTFLQINRLQDELGLDWLIIVAVPETDFMAQIYQNNRNTILLCLLAAGGATLIGVLTAYWISRPILNVARASELIAHNGNFNQQVKTRGIVELDTLINAFNQMARQLQSSFHSLTERNEVLRLSEENYRSLFENASYGIFQSTPDGQFLNVNAAMAHIYGYASPREMTQGISAITTQLHIHPEQRSEFQRQMTTQGQVRNFEYQAFRKNGSVFWAQVDARVVRDRHGQVLYHEGIVQDITARKEREIDLRRELTELKLEIEHSSRSPDITNGTQHRSHQAKAELGSLNQDEHRS